MMSVLVRYLRDRGMDAYLFLLNNEHDHFHPSADSYDLSYQAYTQNLSWGSPNTFAKYLFNNSWDRIRDDLRDMDVIIACDLVPAFLHKAGLSVDIFIPYGSDLYEFPFLQKRKLLSLLYANFQKKGIRNAKFLHLAYSTELYEYPLKKLSYNGMRLDLQVPMIYTKMYDPEFIHNYYNRSQWYQEFKAIRESFDLIIFHQSRHNWKTGAYFNSKGTNRLLQGFSKYVHSTKKIKAVIVTFEYGWDVLHSKSLIKNLGIEKNVFWFPKTMRKEIMVGLSLADIGTAEFEFSYFTSGAICETLSMAKPLMQYRDDALYENR